MAEPLPPYGWEYPDGTDDPADFPALLQSILSDQATKVVGSFDTSASAQAALGTSSATPLFYTTGSPTTLWCLDSSGANQVWTLGVGYTSGSFQMRGQDGTVFGIGTSQTSMWYRVEGARVFGWARLAVGSAVAWPSGEYFWFPLPPFNPVIHNTGESQVIGSCMVNMSNGEHYEGVAVASAQDPHCVLYSNDPHKSTPGATAVRYDTGGTGTGLTWATGCSVQYNFDYERMV